MSVAALQPFHGASMWVGMGSVLTIARWGVQQWNGGEGPRQGTGQTQ